METLIPFLKNSSVVDLLVLTVIFLVTVVLVGVGIWIVIASRSRKPIYLLLMIALCPLLLGLLGTYLRFKGIDRAIAMFPNAGSEIVAASRREAWITTYIGAVGTAVPGLIGVAGLVLKKDGKR